MMETARIQFLLPYLPSMLSLLISVLVMVGTYFVIHRNWDRSVGRDVINGLIQLALGLTGLVVFVMLLPISQVTRENILKFGGLILTGVVAFSSTTVIRDAAAGVTLRLISPFERGDYLSTDDLFGRVTEIGFFYTEIQTEDRSLVTIMNSNLLSTNFRTIPSSGMMLEARLSIGYDVHHGEVENALIEAAEQYGLEDSFVHVEDLGNFAITYRVSGLLTDVENLLAARSNFRKQVLEVMHRNGIEIVSPNFINRRTLEPEERMIPRTSTDTDDTAKKDTTEATDSKQEADRTTEVVFEKALEAQEAEEMNKLIEELEQQLKQVKNSDAEKTGETVEKLESRIEVIKKRKDQLEEKLKEKE